MDYILVKHYINDSTEVDRFEDRVNQHLVDGYEPLGHPVIGKDDEDCVIIVQALIHRGGQV
jgi:hypothetical protein